MSDAQDTMMLIMGVQNEIVGITRFIKYLFLACQNETLRDPPDIEWRSHYSSGQKFAVKTWRIFSGAGSCT